MDFNNLTDLLKHLNSQVADVLENKVGKEVREIMKSNIKSEVYDVYNPTFYKRQREHGGLIDDQNIKIVMVDDNTVSIESRRIEDGRNVGEIVETGRGYRYNFTYSGVPRPFTEATREELKNNGATEHSLYDGLRKKGLDVQK